MSGVTTLRLKEDNLIKKIRADLNPPGFLLEISLVNHHLKWWIHRNVGNAVILDIFIVYAVLKKYRGVHGNLSLWRACKTFVSPETRTLCSMKQESFEVGWMSRVKLKK
jgi:hypothetical protein